MKNEDRERLRIELEEIERDVQKFSENDEDVSSLQARSGDLPAMNTVNLHNYEEEMTLIQERSSDIIDNLVKLYLGDDDKLLNHDYIARKREKDADYFSKLDFLVNSSQRTLISIMKEIDMGAATPRMFEVLSMLQKEMRENIKLSSTNLSNIEKFYKDMREDLGLSSQPGSGKPENEEGEIVSFENLNKKIDGWLKQRADE